jgi:translation initiation factor 2 subunit 1
MIIPKKLPDKDELVLINIKKVMPYGAYCSLVEYNIDAYLPVREVASGWIKNIHEFIKEGQKHVAKVIFIDTQKNAVDVSLKRVREKEKKDKITEYNLENRAQGFYKQALIAAKIQDEANIRDQISKTFVTYSELIDYIYENKKLDNVDKNFEKAMLEIVEKNIKPKVYEVSYIASFQVYNTESGISTIRKTFHEIEGLDVTVTYLGAPNYSLVARGDNYPKAEEKIKKAVAIMEKTIKGEKGSLAIKKEAP